MIDGLSNCTLCNKKQATNYFQKGGYVFWLCQNCKFIFVSPEPINLTDYYNKENYLHGDSGWGYVDYDADKAPMKKNYLQILQKIKKISSGAQLLDVGAANGYFVDIAHSQGFNAVGIDISSSAITEGKQKERNVHENNLLNAYFADNSFDVITLFDVIEHIPASLLKANLEKIKNLLSQHGILVIITPNAASLWARLLGKNWHTFIPPEHLSYFNRSNVTTYLQTNGFNVREAKTINKNFSLQYIFNILYRWQGLSLWKTLTVFFEHLPSFGKISFPLPISDNIVIIAQKKD